MGFASKKSLSFASTVGIRRSSYHTLPAINRKCINPTREEFLAVFRVGLATYATGEQSHHAAIADPQETAERRGAGLGGGRGGRGCECQGK